MHLQSFEPLNNIEMLIKIAESYCYDDFCKKSIQKLNTKKLIKFIIDKKHIDFVSFLNGFLDFTKYEPKFNTLIKNNSLSIKKEENSVTFFFSTVNDYRPDIEVREINYIYDILEDYMYGSDNISCEDFIINTNYNEFCIEFKPCWK